MTAYLFGKMVRWSKGGNKSLWIFMHGNSAFYLTPNCTSLQTLRLMAPTGPKKVCAIIHNNPLHCFTNRPPFTIESLFIPCCTASPPYAHHTSVFNLPTNPPVLSELWDFQQQLKTNGEESGYDFQGPTHELVFLSSSANDKAFSFHD